MADLSKKTNGTIFLFTFVIFDRGSLIIRFLQRYL